MTHIRVLVPLLLAIPMGCAPGMAADTQLSIDRQDGEIIISIYPTSYLLISNRIIDSAPVSGSDLTVEISGADGIVRAPCAYVDGKAGANEVQLTPNKKVDIRVPIQILRNIYCIPPDNFTAAFILRYEGKEIRREIGIYD